MYIPGILGVRFRFQLRHLCIPAILGVRFRPGQRRRSFYIEYRDPNSGELVSRCSAGSICVDMMISNKRRTVVASAALPEEMMIEVFLRLPIKSILRFRAVCRSWDAVLSSEEFCSLHMAKVESASSPPKLFFTSPTASFDATTVYFGSSSGPGDGLLFNLNDISGDFVDLTPAPCRGLTLVFDAVAPAYHVFNAATRAVIQLPRCQAVPFATAGLGFDSRTKNYKVVRLFQGYIQDKQRIKCEVYTLGGECWRPAIGGVPFRFCRAAARAIHHSIQEKMLPVFANESLHWIVDPAFAVQRPRTAILSFSITDETFGWVQSPPFVAPGVQFMELDGHLCAIQERLVSGLHLVELAGQLCVLRDLRNASSDCSKLEVWKLNDYNSGGWSLKHRIDLLAPVGRDLVDAQIVKVIGSVGDCESTGKVVIATSKRKVIVYDPMLGTLETIIEMRGTHSSHQTEHSALRISLFKETLVPVHRTNEEVALSAPVGVATREILLRIPAGNMVQLKLVCKQWLKLIENPSFIRSYSLHHNTEKRPNIMLVGKGTRGSDFSFVPLRELHQHSPNRGTWLDTKVVCSKPCHGLNLLSTKTKDYLYNPCTGYRCINQTRGFTHGPSNVPEYGFKQDPDHAFAVGKKIVGLGFDLLMQEHVIVEIFYHQKDLESHKYSWTCSISTCNNRYLETNLLPPRPVNDMPPTYLAGMLYWMSEPRLSPSSERVIVSYDIASNQFGCIPCPSCIESWNNKKYCPAFVVELEGRLCAVLANPFAEKLDIWRLKHGRWDRAYKIYLQGWSGYSLKRNVVVPWAVDPYDGRILLNTGRKVGLYDPEKSSIETLYDLDEVLHNSVSAWKPPSELLSVINDCSPALPGNNLVCSTSTQSLEEINPSWRQSMPLVPMLYKENLASYPLECKKTFLCR